MLLWSQRGIRSPKYEIERTKNEASHKLRKMENTKQTGYILHDFMIEDMGLSGVALRVYALIYSFTKAGSDCHGSVDYIGERVGASRTGVKDAIKKLIQKGHITKINDDKIKTNRYIANISPTGRIPTGQKKTLQGQKTTPDRSENDPNNKENNKEILTNYDIFDAMTSNDPKGHFGRSRVVRLSYHQYVTLLLRVGFSETFRYIRILEGRILDNPDSVYRNHYKTIVGWAREDGYISEE